MRPQKLLTKLTIFFFMQLGL